MQRFFITEEDINKVINLMGEVRFKDVNVILSILRSKEMENSKEKKQEENKKE